MVENACNQFAHDADCPHGAQGKDARTPGTARGRARREAELREAAQEARMDAASMESAGWGKKGGKAVQRAEAQLRLHRPAGDRRLANAATAQEAIETLIENRAGDLSQNAPSPPADPRQDPARGQSGAPGGATPLTEAELAALQAMLGGGLDTARIAQDTQAAQTALEGAMLEGMGKYPQEPPPPIAAPLHGVARGQNEAGSEEAEPLVTANREYKRDAQGRFDGNGAIRAAQKGGRASGGNPKAATKKTTPQQDVDAVERAIKTTAAHGGKITRVARVGKQSLTIEAGSPGTKAKHYEDGHGSVHQSLKHGKPPENTTPRMAAKAIVHGKRETDEKGFHAIHKQTRVCLGKTGKKGSTKMLTAYKKK